MRSRIYYIVLILLLSACNSLNRLSLYNLSNQYSNTSFTILKAVAFNDGRLSSRVFIPVQMSDMVTASGENSDKNFRKVGIKYELFETYESKHILDSASIIIIDSALFAKDTIITIDIQYPDDRKYILKLELIDLNRVDAVSKYLCLDNSVPASPDNFLLKGADGNLLFENVLGEDEEFFLQLSDTTAKEVFVRYYKREFPLALPPFLEEPEHNFDYRADSVFVIVAEKGETEVMQLQNEGFYHFQTDSSGRGGYTVFRFHKGFPEIISSEQMLQSLRYITTKNEFDEIRFSDDIKLAVDNFWLNNAGNPSRARAMIQKYYGRVVDANNYFTSYLEGWKTDRGLIYIVYGPPKIVFRGKDLEEWLYGEKGNSNSIRLQFVKVENPFTKNDYSLIKSPSYKEKWYNIVNTWRR
ncbi:MAG: GWxTD domain-containing protein [Bacteroidales bacterium]|nr:GWxTD domain-containing protein [Bacteroidales bacterium]